MQAVVDGYRAINPLVSVSIDPKGAGGEYPNWLNTVMSGENLEKVSADIVRNNLSSHLFGSGKFVDFAQYLSEENPYAGNAVWSDTLDGMALVPTGSNGEIYSLSFQSTQVSFYYNKAIFTAAGIDADDIVLWNDLIAACEAVKTYDGGIIPLAVNGSADSFWSGQMSWIFRTYVDQYFRDVTNEVRTQSGDWNFNRFKDEAWAYKPYPSDYVGMTQSEAQKAAWFNDDPRVYSYNELRVLKGVTDGVYGHNTDRYKNMLANLMQVFPKYCGNAFTTQDDTSFWTGKAAIALDTTDLLVEWKKKTDISPDTMFELGRFDFPAMTSHTDYPAGAPAVNYTRSIGGPHGYYGIINKNAKQTALVMDFMKYWVSKAGQEIEMQKRKELGLCIKGVPYVKDVAIPPQINILGDTVLKGVADFNPALIFARGLGNEGLTTRDFQNYTQALFISKTLSVDAYASQMSASMNSNMQNYLTSRGFRANALDNVTVNPF
jgi:ABC-type glycerol-3-phosphate transport system substrate-binding protein